MKIIALEEHLLTPNLREAWRTSPTEADDHAAAGAGGPFGSRLLDLGESRVAAMDDQGVDVQVLSITRRTTASSRPNSAARSAVVSTA